MNGLAPYVWVQQQEAQEREATKVSREITAILDSGAHGTATGESLFWRLAEAMLEMAQKVEALEQREHSHPLGVGSLSRRG